MLFDTRYFWARFTARDSEYLKKLRMLLEKAEHGFVSSITIYEIYKISLEQEGKDVASLRSRTIEDEFKVIDVDSEIAKDGARISSKLKVPMADALIMVTARKLQVSCVTDDTHFSGEVRKIWV